MKGERGAECTEMNREEQRENIRGVRGRKGEEDERKRGGGGRGRERAMPTLLLVKPKLGMINDR